MIARVARRLDQLVDHHARRCAVGVTHPHIDHVDLRGPRLGAHFVDHREHVGGQLLYAIEILLIFGHYFLFYDGRWRGLLHLVRHVDLDALRREAHPVIACLVAQLASGDPRAGGSIGGYLEVHCQVEFPGEYRERLVADGYLFGLRVGHLTAFQRAQRSPRDFERNQILVGRSVAVDVIALEDRHGYFGLDRVIPLTGDFLRLADGYPFTA